MSFSNSDPAKPDPENARAVVPVRVMAVDDHRTTLWGLQRLVDAERPRMEMVGTATSLASGLELARTAHPNVVLLDLDLGGYDGSEGIPGFTALGCRVIILTGVRDPQVLNRAAMRGAHGLLHKEQPAENIVRAIEKVQDGELWLDRLTMARMVRDSARQAGEERAKLDSLTSRERDVIAHVAENPGSGNKSIAGKLHIGEQTLRNHLCQIYEKLELANRFELYLFAHKHGIGKAAGPSASADLEQAAGTMLGQGGWMESQRSRLIR